MISSGIDLHVHTCFSDGALSPDELIDMAVVLGISTVAIADHDTVAGVATGIMAGHQRGIEVMPAVELSVQFQEWRDVHLLGFGIDFADAGFLEKLERFREARVQRNANILERVNDQLASEGRSPLMGADVQKHARDTVGRPHIARALLGAGHASSVEDAFRRYLVPCNIPKAYWAIEDAIQEIRRIGGVAVLAHPTSITTDRSLLRQIIAALIGLGLDGIEVFNNQAQPDDMEFLRRLSLELRLLITAGSDFHGIEPGLEMGKGRGGIRFDGSLLTPLHNLIAQRNPGRTSIQA